MASRRWLIIDSAMSSAHYFLGYLISPPIKLGALGGFTTLDPYSLDSAGDAVKIAFLKFHKRISTTPAPPLSGILTQ